VNKSGIPYRTSRRHGDAVRERIKGFLRLGYSNKEILRQIGISRSGLSYEMRQIRKELGLYGGGDSRRMIVLLVKGYGKRQGKK
jgi:IS30 family transposase